MQTIRIEIQRCAVVILKHVRDSTLWIILARLVFLAFSFIYLFQTNKTYI
jgi:hypothetical protein